jgi:hypothetical protein
MGALRVEAAGARRWAVDSNEQLRQTTLALVWNALNHLNTATRTGTNAIAESYAYDDSGRRIQRVSGAATTGYLYDGDATPNPAPSYPRIAIVSMGCSWTKKRP